MIRSLELSPGHTPPRELRYQDILARAISRADLVADVQGINASLDIIRRTRGGSLPSGPVTEDFNYVDLVWHELEFRDRYSFAYAVYDTSAPYLGCYRSDWREWCAWSTHAGHPTLPAAPAGISRYLTELARHGAAVGTMARRLSSIRFAHRVRNLPDPTQDARVMTVWEGIRRTPGAPPEQAAPLMPPELFDVLDACPTIRQFKTRGRAHEPDLAGARDRALLLVGFTAALRRGELAAPPSRTLRSTPTASRVGAEAPPPLCLGDPVDVTEAAWAAAAECERRVHPHDAIVLSGPSTGAPVRASVVDGFGADGYRIDDAGDRVEIVAGSRPALQWALLTLARHRRGGPASVSGDHAPVHQWRGLHLDLARQFLPAADVDWLIEMAAWRRLNRLHLHLTDDEAWRVPITAFPALTDVGAWRGHGLAIPPLLGAPAGVSGGWYTRHDIASWVRRAGELGIEVVSEVDLPGHSFAALATVPSLVDPDEVSGARSVQHFVDNVLNPGVAATWRFLEAVFGELAELFPGRWVHLGGDEVPHGAWRGSPAAQRWAAQRGIEGTDAIGAAFMREVAELVRTTTGRQVGVWQEAADSGAVAPGDGYVVVWQSIADVRRLAAAGHQIVASPGQAYYLDMAADRDWLSPGSSWAGHSSLADVQRLDVADGWTDDERAGLLGIQACLWTEHVHDRTSMERLLLPRLDAIADAAWTPQIRN